MDPDGRRFLLLVVAIAAALSFIGLDAGTVSLHDEARDAGIGRAMLDGGDYVVPRLNGRPFLEKPPLYWWVQTLSYRIFGITDGAARAPSALFGFLSLLLAFAIGRRLGGPRAGLWSLLVLATFAGFFDLVHRCLVDPSLVFSVALAGFGFLLWIDPRDARERALGAAIWGLSVPLSWLAKGVAGPGFTVAAPLLHLVLTRRFRQLLSAWLPAGIALGASVATIGPYLLELQAAAGREGLRELVFGQTFSRVVDAGGGATHAKPFWWYLAGAPGRLLPWLVVLPALLRTGILRRPGGSTGARALAGMFLFGLLLLSVAADKRGIYFVPLLPLLAGPVGLWFATLGEEGPDRDWDRPTVLGGLAVLAVVPALVAAGAFFVKLVPLDHRRVAFDRIAEGIGPGLLAFVLVAGAAGTFVLLRGFLRFRRSGDTPGPAWLLAPMAVLLLFFQAAVRPIVDRPYSGKPVMDAVAANVGEGDGILLVFGCHESLMGYFYFDQRRQVTWTDDPARLAELLDRGAGPFVLYQRPEGERFPQALRERLEVVWDGDLRKKDPWVLARGRGP